MKSSALIIGLRNRSSLASAPGDFAKIARMISILTKN